jgi:tetratricopeptide (TPR) repeat protein
MQHALDAFQRGETTEADRLCRLLLGVQPDYFDALFLAGLIAEQAGRSDQAVEFLSKAVTANPNVAEAYYNRGVALGHAGRSEEAVASYDQAIALKPDYVDAFFNKGVTLAGLGQPTQAIESYDRAIAFNPSVAEVHNNRGIALDHLQRYDEALASYDRAIALKPDYARAYNNRGVALGRLQRHADALTSYQRAVELKPDFVDAYTNLGMVLGELDRPAEALRRYDQAIAFNPRYAEAFYNRGNALRDLNRHAEAIGSYERALALKPDYAAAHWNLADCYLLLGDFARGWQEYEWRWKLEQRDNLRRDFQQPLWLGNETLAGRTILLHSELGLGDTLQFCRYATEVATLGARVVLEVQPSLLPLLAGLEGVTLTVPRGAPLPAFDCQCPLMSLPLAFKTDLTNVPARIPYLHSDPVRVAAWRRKLGETRKPRIGVVWSGSMALRNDRRSMALKEMLPLMGAWAEWVSLQKELRESDLVPLASNSILRDVGAELSDFADTAAVIELMDVVVTVDTSVAHVAGAMGKPVWIVLPFNPHDWRWMLDREDSIWYPTARVFRQPENGDWASVVTRVNEELIRKFDVAP